MKGYFGAILLASVFQLQAQVIIESFSTNGVITWHSSLTNATGYTVEWAPTPTGPWSRSWASLANISPQAGTNSTYSASVPMFYRVAVSSPCENPGDCCEFPTVLPGEGTYAGTTLGYSNNVTSGTNCAGTAGPDRFYSIAVPAGKRLFATVQTGLSSFDPSISLQLDCNTPRSCLSGDDSGSATTVNSVTYDNAAPSPTPVLIVIDTYSASSPGGPFSLFVAFSDIPPGETCSNAVPLLGDTVLPAETLTGYVSNSGNSTACGARTGNDRYYSLTVPAGKVLTVTATPATGLDVTIGLYSACPATNCLAQASASAAGIAETLQYTNSLPTAQSVFISIDSTTFAGGSYSLSTAITTP